MTDKESKKNNSKKETFLNKYQQVFTNSPIFSKIQYMLQLSFANVSLILKRLYVVGNKGIETKFNTFNENKKTLQVIISEQQISKSQDFSTICDKGFKDILNIQYGKLDLNKMHKQSDDHYEVMICKAAIGKTYIEKIKSYSETIPFQQKPELMTEDFDSVYVYDQNLNKNQFRQNYIMYDPQNRCLPEFIAHFYIEPSKYRQLQQQILCQLCEDNVARKYCETEDACFCISCDNSHHQNRLAYKHKRTELTEKPKVLGYCQNHPGLKMELFCIQCSRPICINCKVKGDHSSGQMLTHNLVRINEKYYETSKAIKEVDPNLQKKKNFLSNQIKMVEGKLKEINKKSLQLQDKIYEILGTTLKQLERITKKKMALLMSDHLQLKRQLDQIQWIQNYLQYQFQALTPNDFLLSYSRHEFKKKDILADKFQPMKILPDMRVQGTLNVLTQQESRALKGVGAIVNKKEQDELEEIGKSNIFKKADDKNSNILKSKIQWTDPIDSRKEELLTSKNNLLNLSILKNL